MSDIGDLALRLMPDRPDREFKGDGSRWHERAAFCAGAAMALSTVSEPVGYGVARIIEGGPPLVMTVLNMSQSDAEDLRQRFEESEGPDGHLYGYRVISYTTLPLAVTS